MVSSFCRSAAAYVTANDEILVCFTSSFAMDMVQKDGGRERLRAALSATLKKEIPDSKLIVEVNEARCKSAMDELIDSFEE